MADDTGTLGRNRALEQVATPTKYRVNFIQEVLLKSTALVLDVVGFVLMCLVIGEIGTEVLGIVGDILFFVWFMFLGADYFGTNSDKKFGVMFFNSLAEAVPFVNGLYPGFSIEVWQIIKILKQEDEMKARKKFADQVNKKMQKVAQARQMQMARMNAQMQAQAGAGEEEEEPPPPPQEQREAPELNRLELPKVVRPAPRDVTARVSGQIGTTAVQRPAPREGREAVEEMIAEAPPVPIGSFDFSNISRTSGGTTNAVSFDRRAALQKVADQRPRTPAPLSQAVPKSTSVRTPQAPTTYTPRPAGATATLRPGPTPQAPLPPAESSPPSPPPTPITPAWTPPPAPVWTPPPLPDFSAPRQESVPSSAPVWYEVPAAPLEQSAPFPPLPPQRSTPPIDVPVAPPTEVPPPTLPENATASPEKNRSQLLMEEIRRKKKELDDQEERRKANEKPPLPGGAAAPVKQQAPAQQPPTRAPARTRQSPPELRVAIGGSSRRLSEAVRQFAAEVQARQKNDMDPLVDSSGLAALQTGFDGLESFSTNQSATQEELATALSTLSASLRGMGRTQPGKRDTEESLRKLARGIDDILEASDRLGRQFDSTYQNAAYANRALRGNALQVQDGLYRLQSALRRYTSR